MLGFDPAKLTKTERFHRIEAQAKAEEVQKDKSEAGDILGRLKTDPADAKYRLLELSQQNQERPEQLAQRVAKTSVDQVFPEDVRAGLPKQQAQHLMDIAKTMGVPLPQANQMMRETYMQNVMGQLGQHGRANPWAMQEDQTEGYSPFQGRQDLRVPR